eukprot:TRINITY_DN8421_c0_g1_i2.p1 TRINITY_DN8421_c0_g1~~TRINITY_DN8421_c0_g1_i2.p1  ORF type:complete len:305 (-),score=58.88 TRINITY_DN8421_c0_g1_i2:589-1503(-)
MLEVEKKKQKRKVYDKDDVRPMYTPETSPDVHPTTVEALKGANPKSCLKAPLHATVIEIEETSKNSSKDPHKNENTMSKSSTKSSIETEVMKEPTSKMKKKWIAHFIGTDYHFSKSSRLREIFEVNGLEKDLEIPRIAIHKYAESTLPRLETDSLDIYLGLMRNVDDSENHRVVRVSYETAVLMGFCLVFYILSVSLLITRSTMIFSSDEKMSPLLSLSADIVFPLSVITFDTILLKVARSVAIQPLWISKIILVCALTLSRAFRDSHEMFTFAIDVCDLAIPAVSIALSIRQYLQGNAAARYV